MQFIHLHVHSHYSVLDGMSKVPDLIAKCLKNKMYAMALTDHGNMFGIKEFLDVASSTNKKNNDQRKEQQTILNGIADGSLIETTKKKIKEIEGTIADIKDKKALDEAKAQLKELNERVTAIESGALKEQTETTLAKIPQEFKPIVGVEAYCARRSLYQKDKNEKFYSAERGKDVITDWGGYHLILLAKDKIGYHNLCKMISIAWIDGVYNHPRIDKDLLTKYHEGIICCSACLGGELSQLILNGQNEEAEKSALWFKELFGDDYYIELQRHKTDKLNADTTVYQKQQKVNEQLIAIARKHNIKIIATNDVHFVEEEHGEAHDRLVCLSTDKKVADTNRMHYTKQEWLKTPNEMAEVFADLPEAIANTQEIADKVVTYNINSDPIMPKFAIPETFGTEEQYREQFTEQMLFDEFTQNEKHEVVLSQADAEAKIKKLGGYDKLYRIKLEADYLAKLAWEGAEMRYGKEMSDEIKERIIFELHIMKTMGFPGYFLIVQDFIKSARAMGVSVGPGRGSAAGSAVAYCLTITDVDPIKYDLLFERFLNPDRISLPDIDVDFDDDGREKVLDWVTEKYGADQVAHIITYGTMATKSSIKDVGRVQEVPLKTVNEVVALIPDKFSESLAEPGKKPPKVTVANCLKYVPELKNLYEGIDMNVSTMLGYAAVLEDTIRQIGIHACGVIIGADDLKKFAPLATQVIDKNTGKRVLVTQYDGHVVESVGLIKMDFLGLKTLSIIKEALKNIKKARDIDLDINHIDIEDEETYKLYARGATVGIFQFESAGMQKYLRELKPTVFADLIAMNALYRPGPMDYIPDFIERKRDPSKVKYDIDVMEKYLGDTYGITVYQEQVMLLSRLLAGFTRGQSDALRKAMGKKLRKVLDELKPKFINGGIANGHNEQVLEKIWADWEKFASYAFNKSHATCYAWVSYQTAFLKAHYPAEFMAALLTRSKDVPADVAKFMDECKAMGLKVKGPDINESELTFTVNHNGEVRFGLGAIKGVGESAVNAIINARNEKGNFKDIYDFVERVPSRDCNKKTLENLINAGAFDSFEYSREQLTGEVFDNPNRNMLDELVKYSNDINNSSINDGPSLFDGLDELTNIDIKKPRPANVKDYSLIARLNKEKDLIGIYLSSHPLDKYGLIIRMCCNSNTKEVEEYYKQHRAINFNIGGIVVDVRNGITKNDKPYGIILLEDYYGTIEIPLFGNDWINYKKFAELGYFIQITGTVQQRSFGNREPTKDSPWDKKVLKICMLDENSETQLKKLDIKINLDKINPTFINEFSSIVNTHKGASELSITIRDTETEHAVVPLQARSHNVKIDRELIDKLLQLSKITKFQIYINDVSYHKAFGIEEEENIDDMQDNEVENAF